ncbi:hypothetical protein MTR67_028938 [Solanum verrucosum]|uniref:Bidirectional sugar transporter SWEET n=1 Tax=Solanum verrucosum TaxID=315347 RepID=A0AAF0R7K0_SOLVR|nr:hypothetical protein MTR67_028938 [Solanum verrucosum]
MVGISDIFLSICMAVSFIVFLAPLPTFYNIYKKKSTEGYQSIPYVVALCSAMILIYYVLLKGHMVGVIIINAIGVFIETIYIVFYIFYAPKKAKVQTIKLLLLFVVVGYGGVFLVAQFLLKGAIRTQIVGWISTAFSVCTFVAPLGIMRKVIKTKNVEYMPFLLSFFLTLSAVLWFIYGFTMKDYVIYGPNILGFTLGVVQMVLYVVYKNKKESNVTKEQKLSEVLQNHVIILEDGKELTQLTQEQIIDIWKLGTLIYSEKLNASAAEVDNNRPNIQTN